MVLKALVDQIWQFFQTLKISKGSVFTILHEHLRMRKLYLKWVPGLLTVDQKQQSVDDSERSVLATGNLKGDYVFQKMDCAIRRKVGHRVIVSCFGQRNMIYKFLINI